MIDFRAKALKIEEEGRKRREVRKADGWQEESYQWWCRENGRDPLARTNYCHFWRVLLIWAPLLKFRLRFRRSRRFRWSFILGAVAVLAVLSVLFGIQSVVIGTLAGTYIVVGLVLTGMVRHDELNKSSTYSEQVKRRYRRIKLVFAPMYALVWLISTVWMSRPVRWVRDNGPMILLVGFLALVVIGVIAAVMAEGWIVILQGLGVIAVFVAFVALMSWIGSLFSAASARRKQRHSAEQAKRENQLQQERFEWLNDSRTIASLREMYEPLLIGLFLDYCPEQAGNYAAFCAWRDRFENHMNKWKDGTYEGYRYESFYGVMYVNGLGSWYSRDPAQQRFRREFSRMYDGRHIDIDPRWIVEMAQNQPSRTQKLGRVLVDLAYMAYNGVRVTKWKICPIMKFEEV